MDIRAALFTAQEPSTFDSEQRFLPVTKLRELVCEENIVVKLKEHSIDGRTDLMKFILYKAQGIFATLVYLRREIKIVEFWEHNLGDSVLPITSLGSLSARRALVFQEWNESDAQEFMDAQWHFQVPIFSPSLDIKSFPVRRIFPFHIDGKRAKRTPFSRVWQVRIHTGHGIGVRQTRMANIWHSKRQIWTPIMPHHKMP
ncbi:hypothetical protein EJ08DRAFT_299429 [Tothia fuscella]|uniref:Uncharacterized protein n=1 Tax=Tothia fuscella TaxID=1048955 RepID=A0A9P4NPI1_9PEZI|nr:hypothetical protein EJ08DRAFT_299429 [Tothia fuscella]